MKTEEIRQKVHGIIGAYIGVVDWSKLTDASRLGEDLGADSLDRVELVMALEKEFGITFPQGVEFEVETVGSLVALVERLKNGDA